MQFRTKLAAEAGIALHCMEGFTYCIGSDKVASALFICKADDEKEPSFANYISRQPVISWDKLKDDIVPFLNHSDCEGELTPEECATIDPRLRELIKDWPDDDNDKIKALELAGGMELAAKNNEPLEFC